MEFDPQLEVELNHAPRGWQDAELHTSPAAFLQGMRPLLDAYLAAQGEAALQDVEWQVRRSTGDRGGGRCCGAAAL
jgi:hypothetical protein